MHQTGIDPKREVGVNTHRELVALSGAFEGFRRRVTAGAVAAF